MKIELAGRCGNCGNRLEIRQTEVRENEDDVESKIIGWIVMGLCEKCKIIYPQRFIKQEKEPSGVDFKIDYDKDAVGTNELEFAKSQNKETENGDD